MIVELAPDLVQENVDALARFARLFESPRFHRLACPGVDPGAATDLKTLNRLMTEVMRACKSRGFDVPVIDSPVDGDVVDTVVEMVSTAMDEAGVGAGEVIIQKLKAVLDTLDGDKAPQR